MYWSKPKDKHIIYEALSAISDNRFNPSSESLAVCFSSSKDKFYTIEYDKNTNSIMSNDNMAFYVGEVSYPMVALLLSNGTIEYDKEILKPLSGIKWKEINQKNRNDYMKSVAEVLANLKSKGHDILIVEKEVDRIYSEVLKLNLKMLGQKVFPPKVF
ncbi:MAG: hypothetical protein WCO33_02600 [bacterium]